MKNKMKGKVLEKRIMAVLLLGALLFGLLPGNLQLAYAENTPEENGYVTAVTGLEVWEKVWLKESVTVTENVLVTGEVVMEPGAAIILTSGQFVMESQATITGDIYIEQGATANIAGTVNGTVYVNSTEAGAQREDWDGSLVRANNFEGQDAAYIETLILNGVGFGYIDCTVGTLEVTENYNGDYGTGNHAVIQVMNYCGSYGFNNSGRIYQANVTGGKNFSNNSDGIIDSIRVSDGLFFNNGLVHFAVLENNGRITNTNVQESQWNEAMIEHLVIKEDAGEIVVDGEYYRNLENYGNIKSLIAYGGDVVTLGDVDYLYADGCRNLFIETCSWRIDRGTDYQVEYLYARNTAVSVQDWTDNRTQQPHVRKARIENGSLNLADAKIEELYLEGSFTGITFDRVELYELYLGMFELTEQTNIQLSNPEEVVIVDFGAASEVKDAFDLIMAEYSSQMSEEDKALLMDFMFEVRDISPSGNTISEKEFTKNIDQYDLITIEFSAASAVGAVVVESPSGYEFVIMSKDETTTEGFMAYESGEYRFRAIGDEYGGELQVEISKAAKLELDVYTQYASEFPEDAQKEKDTLEEYHVSVYDLTTGKEVTGFITEGEQVLFQENPRGHKFAMTLTSITESWEWEAVTVEFTLNEGETKQLEVVMKQFGDYYGYTQDGTIPQVYLYDTNGKFVRRCDTDSYGNFWAGRLPSGEYTAILLRDDTGNYKFSTLAEYEAYGLKEKEDYLKDSFTLEAGVNICYPDIQLPEAPKADNPYFNTEVTAFNTNRQITVAGELIQLSLDYEFKEEFASKVSGLMFRFPMSEEAELKEGSVTINGKIVTNYEVEDGSLLIPADETTGSVCFQITSEQTDVTLVTLALAEFILNGKECTQFLGTASTMITTLTLKLPDVITTNELTVSGYTSPGETVSILDNNEEIATFESNASGYYSGTVLLKEGMVLRHKICAARQFGTSSEFRTAEQTVTIHATAPELLQFNMYYYVHGHSAKFELSGEEFRTKRFIYDYWPGSVFTFEIKLTNSNMVEQLYVVSNNGSVKKLEAFYDAAEDMWVASGIFSEDENYAPADFDIEYILKEIDIETEIGDFDLWRDMTTNTELIDSIYETANKEFSEYIYNEENNSVSNTLKVSFGEEEYSCDYEITYQATEETKETLLAKGYEVEEIDGTDYFYKFELDYDTWIMTATSIVLANDSTEVAAADELMLFSVPEEGSIEGPAMLQQTMKSNVKDVVVNQIASLPDEVRVTIFEAIPQAVDVTKDISDQLEAWKPAIGPGGFMSESDQETLDDITNVIEWIEVVSGVDALTEQKKYFDKLRELERKLDAIEQARQEGKGGNCAFIPLDSFYDDIAASYKAAGDLANAKWSFEWVKKTCASGADAAVSAKGSVKKKLPNGEIQELSIKDALKIKKFDTNGKKGMEAVVLNQKNLMLKNFQKYLSIEKMYEAGIDAMAGDTLDYWTRANEEHLMQLELNIDLLLMLSGTEAGSNSSGSESSNTGSTGSDTPAFQMKLNSDPAAMKLRANGGGCYTPQDLAPYPGGTIPGGGGAVNWDPSGYVYEAVPSNRLAGVTATTYYRGEDGSEVLWDAEEYGQINPQVTDSKGNYGWFVPEGDWKVVYTKDGYEIAETEWLPVPPPQTEVNVGLVSTEAPELKNVVISPANAQVTFSRYVTVDSVTEKVLFVNGISGTIEAVNAEAGTDGTMLASKFRIVFTEQATVGADYTVVIKNGIMGYNGLSVSAKEQAATCAVQPESISVELPDYIVIGEENTIKVTIAAEGGFDSMTLECVSNTEFIEVIRIGKVSSEGTAELVVKGKKAGVSLLELTVAGSDVVLEQDVVTASEQDVGLMKYVEKQKNQVISETVTEEENNNSMMLWIAIAAVLVVLAGVFGVVLTKKRKKTA